MEINLLGKKVEHILFGKGIITNVSGEILTILFTNKQKRFLYPDAFYKFLTLDDSNTQEKINTICRKKLQDKELIRKKEYEEEQIRQLRYMKIKPNSQAAFNINFNDLDNIIDYGFVSTGKYLSGMSKGKPKIPKSLNPNSACLLTSLPDNKNEADRLIIGAFMVQADFFGKQCENGIIKKHKQYNFILPSNISLYYWKYIDNKDFVPRWGNVTFKYFSNKTMQLILSEIIPLLSDTEQKSAVENFYKYFCAINKLPKTL